MQAVAAYAELQRALRTPLARHVPLSRFAGGSKTAISTASDFE